MQKKVLKKNNLEIAALSTHGNPVHPDPAVAKQFHDDFENAVLLYEKINEMGTTVVVVTHSQEIVERMQKRVITMKRGVMVSDEKRGELHED